MGKKTIETESVSNQHWSAGGSTSTQKASRNLMNPDEIINLDPIKSIVLIDGKPYIFKKISYFKDNEFRKLLK